VGKNELKNILSIKIKGGIMRVINLSHYVFKIVLDILLLINLQYLPFNESLTVFGPNNWENEQINIRLLVGAFLLAFERFGGIYECKIELLWGCKGWRSNWGDLEKIGTKNNNKKSNLRGLRGLDGMVWDEEWENVYNVGFYAWWRGVSINARNGEKL